MKKQTSKVRLGGNGIITVIIVIAVIGLLVFLAWKLGLFGMPGRGKGEQDDQPTRQNIVTTAEQTDVTTNLTTVTTAETTLSSSEAATETTTAASATEKQPVFVDITVSGNGYTYQNRSYADNELQALVTALDAAVKEAVSADPDTDVLVRITDQEASLNAYNALIEKLNEVHIRYVEAKS